MTITKRRLHKILDKPESIFPLLCAHTRMIRSGRAIGI